MTGMVYTTHLTHLGLAQDLPLQLQRPRIDTGAALIQRHQAEPEKYKDQPDAGFKDQRLVGWLESPWFSGLIPNMELGYTYGYYIEFLYKIC